MMIGKAWRFAKLFTQLVVAMVVTNIRYELAEVDLSMPSVPAAV